MSDLRAGEARLDGALRPIHHVGYAVADLSAAAESWASTVGAGPFLALPPATFDEIAHIGGPARFEHRSAFGQWGPLVVELQEIGEVEPERLRAAVSAPAPSINHVAYIVPDVAAERDRLVELGMPAVLHTRSGPIETSLHEAPGLGHAIELHRRSDFLLEFFASVAAVSRDWDGRDVLREL